MHLDECALNRRLSNPAAQTKQMAAIRAAPLWPRASLAAMARGEPAGRLNRLEYQKVARRRDFFRRFENRAARARFPLARHPVDLRHSAAVAGEVNPLPIRRKLGLGIDVTVIRQTPQTASIRIDEIDLRVAG